MANPTEILNFTTSNDAASETNASFLGLPTETRLNIYSHLNARSIIYIGRDGRTKINRTKCDIFALTQTTHCLRRETLQIYLSSVVFEWGHGHPDRVQPAIPPQYLANIQEITFEPRLSAFMMDLTTFPKLQTLIADGISLERFPSRPTDRALIARARGQLLDSPAETCVDSMEGEQWFKDVIAQDSEVKINLLIRVEASCRDDVGSMPIRINALIDHFGNRVLEKVEQAWRRAKWVVL